jgi:hypothetical protein
MLVQLLADPEFGRLSKIARKRQCRIGVMPRLRLTISLPRIALLSFAVSNETLEAKGGTFSG